MIIQPNGKGNPTALFPSTEDCVELARAVGERFDTIRATTLARHGKELKVPDTLANDWKILRGMIARFTRGDFRNSQVEYRALKAIAEWTCEVNAKLRNQPVPKIAWK